MEAIHTRVHRAFALHLGALLRSKLVRYAASGGVLTSYAFGLNVFLIGIAHLYAPLAYAIVVTTHMLLGFIFNRWFVFEKGPANLVPLSISYVMLSVVFRAIDWASFTVQVQLLSVHYIYAQLMNSAVLVFAKYFVFKRLFERGQLKANLPAL